ncbi:MAG TPA: nucleotidyltransferase family protein [Vicinamibacterales bacterium]|nr:nucleotidyltransferase family protein [Vicinamibacterales bacterium]
MEPLDLLVASARQSLGAPRRGITAPRTVWHALPDAAERHGMSAWVHASLQTGGDAPAEIRAAIEARARAQRIRALHAVSQLTSIVQSLRRAGIESVALKGPLLSAWLYGDLGMRRFTDLDLLIDREQREAALRILSGDGYVLRGGMSVATARVVYAGTGAWPLTHPAGFPVDLHWRAQAHGFASPFGPREVLRDSITVPAAGGDVNLPCAPHAAVLGLLHAAKHLWTSLELVLSIAHVMRRSEVDWTLVYRLSKNAGAWNACAAGMTLANELFDVIIPAVAHDHLRTAAIDPLVRMARAFLRMPDVAGAPLRAELRAHCASLDTLRGRGRYAAWRLLAPTPLEPAWWPLPDRLAPLYAPVRLIRLAMRRGVRVPH